MLLMTWSPLSFEAFRQNGLVRASGFAHARVEGLLRHFTARDFMSKI